MPVTAVTVGIALLVPGFIGTVNALLFDGRFFWGWLVMMFIGGMVLAAQLVRDK